MSTGWRPIPGFPGYEASSEGVIRPAKPRYRNGRGSVLKPWTEERFGRLAHRVSLHIEGVRTKQFVHRLVCLAWHGLPPEGDERIDCCHIDHNSLNNVASNLKWDTHAKNIEANYERAAIMEEELTELTGSLASPSDVPF
jgi:hypothetical protein